MLSIQEYTDSSDSGGEDHSADDLTAHLKPIDQKTASNLTVAINTAPEVVTKVTISLSVITHQPRSVQVCEPTTNNRCSNIPVCNVSTLDQAIHL